MQLIKNVFLTREKTMARKLEEILLVYMLENNYIVSKERMFEVYLNLIEWGPNVYGIGEASRFYFQKSPAELTLNEALYLASIVPSPKGFMYKFELNNIK
jgi:membrane peptidoglycan carboxypeptidase